jgi:hypothetical protein
LVVGSTPTGSNVENKVNNHKLKGKKMFDDEYESDFEPEVEDQQIDESAVKNSEFVKMLREKAVSFLGCESERMDSAISRFIDELMNMYLCQMKEAIGKHVETCFFDSINKQAETLVLQKFTEAIETRIVSEDKSKFIITTVQEKVLNFVKKFFADQWDTRDKRDKVLNQSIENIIGGVVKQRVDETIEAIKTETVEKFNKEVLRKMAEGIMKSFKDDKRLLSYFDE